MLFGKIIPNQLVWNRQQYLFSFLRNSILVVWRISCIKFGFEIGKRFSKAFGLMYQDFGDDAFYRTLSSLNGLRKVQKLLGGINGLALDIWNKRNHGSCS